MGLRSADEVRRRIADLGRHDAYAVLDVAPDAPPERIARAYRRAMVRAHPDRGGSPERAQLVNCAYEVLTRYRDVYDRRRRLAPGADLDAFLAGDLGDDFWDDARDGPGRDAGRDAREDPRDDLGDPSLGDIEDDAGAEVRDDVRDGSRDGLRDGGDAAAGASVRPDADPHGLEQPDLDAALDPESDAPPPLRVDPAAADHHDREPPRQPGGRRFWFGAAALVLVVVAVVIQRQLSAAPAGAGTAVTGWTTSRLTPSGPAPAADASPTDAGSPTDTGSPPAAGSPTGSAPASGPAASASASAPGSPSGVLSGSAAVPPADAGSPSPSGSPTVTQGVAAHQCVVRPDASLWCWGVNRRGQLGDGTGRDSSAPVRVGGASDRWLTVSVGVESSCALRADASLWCWGDNTFGQLGDGTTSVRSAPVRVAAGTGWGAVAVGAHTCAVRSDHTLWCWGAGEHGELGDGTAIGRRVPGQVGAETTWAAVTVAGARTCAVRQNGTTACWGVPAA